MVFSRSKKQAGELLIPPAAQGVSDALELVRFWTAGGRAHVSLSTAMSSQTSKGQEGVLWGIVLADIARHAANAVNRSGQSDLDQDELMTQITQTYLNELGYGRDMSGSIIEEKD